MVFDLLRLRTKREGRTHVVSARGELDLFVARGSGARAAPGARLRRGPDRARPERPHVHGLRRPQGDPLHGRPVERPARPLPRTARTGKRRSCLLDHQRRPAALVPDMTSVAIVGGGFGGIGAAVMLSREGYHDVTVFERGDRVGGRLELQHLSRHRLRRALAPLRVLLRAQPQLVAALRAGGRDPGLHGGRGSPARGARPRPAAHGGHGSRVRRGSAGAGCSRPRPVRTRPTCSSRHAASSRFRASRRFPGSTTSRVPRSTRPAGATTWTSRASGSRWWAPAAARFRWGRPSSPTLRSSTSTSARPAGRSRRWTSSTAPGRAGSSSARRRSSGSTARSPSPSWRPPPRA